MLTLTLMTQAIHLLVYLQGKYRVYIDPFAANLVNAADQYYVVGYKGTSPYDAGLFYCPYVPLQMVRAVGQDTFQPKIGFKTRYGMVANPFAEGTCYKVLVVLQLTLTVTTEELKFKTLCNFHYISLMKRPLTGLFFYAI